MNTIVGVVVRISQRLASIDQADGTSWRVGFLLLRQVVYIRLDGRRQRVLEATLAVVPQGPEVQEQATDVAVGEECELKTVHALPHRFSWARLLKRVFDIDMQHCPNCGAGELTIIAALVERPVIQ